MALVSQLQSISGSRVFSGPAVPRRTCRYASPRAAVELPPPPYSLDALEPKMSKAYVDNLNKQISGKDLDSKPLEDIIMATWNNGSPSAEFNNAAQAWNHTFFWESMSPNGGGEPTGELKSTIEKDFGSYDEFKTQFKTAGATQFGSGWAWLILEGGKLKVTKTPNAENPVALGQTPLLTMDVWEHAYYLDTQNRRPDYIATFIDELINWDKVAERYAAAK